MTMFAHQFVSVTNGFTDRQRQAAELLIAGVAFQQDGTTWEVYSHEGDYIGKMSTYIVCETAHMLKKAGLKINNTAWLKEPGANPTKPHLGAISFGHNSFPPDEVQRMMDRRFKRPFTLL